MTSEEWRPPASCQRDRRRCSARETREAASMTTILGKKLMLVGKLALMAGALVVALQQAGCCDRVLWSEERDLEGKRRVEMPIALEHTLAMTGRPSEGKVWKLLGFAEPVHFRRTGEWIEVFGYQALTLADFGEAHTGKYAMRARLRMASSTGGGLSGVHYVMDVEDVRLVAKLVAPRAPPGKRGILPGEVVVRKLRQGELQRLDDRYLIELPGGVSAKATIYPLPEHYAFRISVTNEGAEVPLQVVSAHRFFETVRSGVYELRVQRAEAPAPKEPASYRLEVVWGNASSEGNLDSGDVQWREVRAPAEAGADR